MILSITRLHIFPNITVNYKDELYAQILSSDCVIHDACTTGIEAAAFGIPVLGLRPKLVVNHILILPINFIQFPFCAPAL